MIFLRKYELIEIHGKLIEEFGGTHGLRDDAALESAMAAAENRAYYEEAAGEKSRDEVEKIFSEWLS